MLSSKRIHPGTRNNSLHEPLSEIQDGEKPDVQNMPKFRRKRKSVEDVPLSLTPSTSILDAFSNEFDDNDDGFTTIKDLAERGITKMEPLDYDDFLYDNDDDDFLNEDSCTNYSIIKNEAADDQENNPVTVKEEPVNLEANDDEDISLSELRKKAIVIPIKKKKRYNFRVFCFALKHLIVMYLLGL